jgi:hypothetical protein
MYHPTSISPLSEAQITKALKGLPVRVSAGNQHDIELSKEQLKKFAKANQLGKAMNITLDPFQIQNHMRLIGSGVSRTKKYNNWVDTLGARQVIDAGMSKGASSISGMGVSRSKKYNKWVDTLGARPVIDAGMSSATRAISGSGYMRDAHNRMLMPDARKASSKYGPGIGNTEIEDDEYDGPLYLGSGVSRRKKYNKWTDTLGARPVIDAGMSSATRAISGFGLKKRGRPRKSGGALYPAGV